MSDGSALGIGIAAVVVALLMMTASGRVARRIPGLFGLGLIALIAGFAIAVTGLHGLTHS
jgi:hypothetical protein